MTPQFRDRRASLLVTASGAAPTCHTALLSLVIKVPRTPKGSRMTLSLTQQAAQALAQASSLAVFATMAIWYVAPWLNSRGRAAALTPLLWVHVFRYVALQTVSAGLLVWQLYTRRWEAL